MTGFGFTLKFFTLQQNNISEKNVSLHQYYGKDAITEGAYHELKKSYVMNRGETWMPRNKRPEKLRDSIKVFEDVLKSNEVVFIKWKSNDFVQIVFNSGLLVSLSFSNTQDISKITFEKSFVGKLPVASSGVLGDQFVCLAFIHQTKLTFSTLKPEVKMITVDLPGPQAKIQRRLCVNDTEEFMICWWQFGVWMQTAREHERINVVLLRCSFGSLEVMSSIETENDLLQVEFSRRNSNQILTIEKSYNSRNESHVDSVVYEFTKDKMQRLHLISFPVTSGVLSFARNSTEDKLVIGCSDGSAHIFDLTIQKPLATVTRVGLIPTIASWVGPLILAGSAQGEVKVFDSALNAVSLFDFEEREFPVLQLSEYLSSGNSLIKLVPSSVTSIMMLFNGGPLSLLTIQGRPTTLAIIKQHLRVDKVSKAIFLLASLNWNNECDQAYHGLLAVADWLLQKPLNYEREKQLEETFSCFYSPKHQLSDSIVLKCRSTVGCYARRFFHHLLRHQRFEKAFLLAKDINSSDLFLDIYFAAKDLGEIHLAQVAKLKADEIIAADNSEEDPMDEWTELAGQHISKLIPVKKHKSDMNDALEKEFSSNENSSSTLKVTNLGYV